MNNILLVYSGDGRDVGLCMHCFLWKEKIYVFQLGKGLKNNICDDCIQQLTTEIKEHNNDSGPDSAAD